MSKKFDVVIIGAGAIGCAIAYEFSRRFPNERIAILEKNDLHGQETSRNNSGVIHSGLHLNPSFLKAKFAREGKEKVVAFCQQHGVPHRRCGMIVVGSFPRSLADIAAIPDQLGALKALRGRARAQGIEAKMLTTSQVKAHESAISSLLGIAVDDVYIIDPVAYVSKLLEEAQRSGRVELFTKQCVREIERGQEKYSVLTDPESFDASLVINAAGLYAHEVARMAGFNYSVYFYSGEYYRVISEKKNHIRGTLVYPATRPGSPGLGIHITKKLTGEVYLGPNAKPSVGPVFDIRNRTSPDVFVRAVKPFWPEITVNDVEWAYVGIRPKAVEKGEGDFVIQKEGSSPALINLIGIESPGLTASLAIAQHVSNLR